MEKADAMLQELQQQVIMLSTRASVLAGELAERETRIASLTSQVEKQAEELTTLKPKDDNKQEEQT